MTLRVAAGLPVSLYLCTDYIYLTLFVPAELHLSGKLRDYGVTVPCSTDFRGRFLSHVLSRPAAAASAGSTGAEGAPALQSHSGPLRVARSLPRPEGATLYPGRAGRPSLYFNVTVFGEELHLRLRPNRRLVVPGASVEWQEDFRELFRQPLRRECVYTGDVMGMPGAAVAISNCDGLVRTSLSSSHFLPLTPGHLSLSDAISSLAPLCLRLLWAQCMVWAMSRASLPSEISAFAPLATRLPL